MANLRYYVLIWILRVCICTSTKADNTTNATYSRIWDINEIKTGRESSISYDGAPKMLSRDDLVCYQAHLNCTSDWFTNARRTNQILVTSVCAHHKKYGLVAFRRDCDINLNNCLNAKNIKSTDKEISEDEFYYNGRGKNCDYYVRQTYTINDANKLYLLHGERKLEKLKNEMQQKAIANQTHS